VLVCRCAKEVDDHDTQATFANAASDGGYDDNNNDLDDMHGELRADHNTATHNSATYGSAATTASDGSTADHTAATTADRDADVVNNRDC
jgi:hypothetical protein